MRRALPLLFLCLLALFAPWRLGASPNFSSRVGAGIANVATMGYFQDYLQGSSSHSAFKAGFTTGEIVGTVMQIAMPMGGGGSIGATTAAARMGTTMALRGGGSLGAITATRTVAAEFSAIRSTAIGLEAAAARNTVTVAQSAASRVMYSQGVGASTGKGSQALLNAFVEKSPHLNKPGAVKLTAQPTYVQNLGINKYGQSLMENGKPVSRISDLAFSSNRNLLDTVVHEELHLRIANRIMQNKDDWLKLRISGAEEDYVESVVARYMRNKK